MEKPDVTYPFSGHFLLAVYLWRRRMSVYITLFAVAIPVNSINKFREGYEATVFIECFQVNYVLCLIFIKLSIWRVIVKYFGRGGGRFLLAKNEGLLHKHGSFDVIRKEPTRCHYILTNSLEQSPS
jgi:hypothetical protein